MFLLRKPLSYKTHVIPNLASQSYTHTDRYIYTHTHTHVNIHIYLNNTLLSNNFLNYNYLHSDLFLFFPMI